MTKPGKPAKKYSQAARLHDVIRILEARYGATVDELAEECRVSRRTVFRDLQAIGDAGYPLVWEREADGRVLYRFITGFKRIPPITFSLQELMTLYLSRGQLAFLRGTPFQDDLDAIFGRIRSSLPPRSVAHLERIAEAAAPLFQGVRDYGGQAGNSRTAARGSAVPVPLSYPLRSAAPGARGIPLRPLHAAFL